MSMNHQEGLTGICWFVVVVVIVVVVDNFRSLPTCVETISSLSPSSSSDFPIQSRYQVLLFLKLVVRRQVSPSMEVT